MSKNREVKRRRKMQKKRSRAQSAPKRQTVHRKNRGVPSAQTMWRTMHLNFQVQEMLAATTMDLQPSLWKRDANQVQRIERADGLEAVLDLAPAASGLAEYAWLKRLLDFGSSVAPAIVARVSSDWMRTHTRERTGIQERAISALRFCDGQAADALVECWDALDDYGRSLASVALGLLDAQTAVERLWTFFQKTRSEPKSIWVGPLWGLIDLGDNRAGDALVDLLAENRAYYEKYGFLSRAGDRRVVLPLVAEILDGAEEMKGEATWALTGIAHRLGREPFCDVFRDGADTEETADRKLESFVDRIFLYSQEDVEKHFETFYDRNASSLTGFSRNVDRPN